MKTKPIAILAATLALAAASAPALAAKPAANAGKKWTPAQTRQLKKLTTENTPTRVIGIKTGRSENAIYSKASKQGITLKPVNQRPYNRRKK
jgi:hypothetical protein